MTCFNHCLLYVLGFFPSSHRPVCNASEVMQIINSVLRRRAHCPTLIHTDSSRSHLIVTLTISSKSPNAVALGEIPSQTCTVRHNSCKHLTVTFSLFPLARRLQSAKKDMQRSTQKEWWSPRCQRANPASRHSSEEHLFASTASSPCPSPLHSPCPSPRPSISQAPFKTKLQLVDLAGSECVGKREASITLVYIAYWSAIGFQTSRVVTNHARSCTPDLS